MSLAAGCIERTLRILLEVVDRPEAEMLQETFSDLEERVQGAVRAVGRDLLQMRLQRDPRAQGGREFRCGGCHGRLRIQEAQQKRRLATLLGDIEYSRPYGVCDRCKISYAPLDCEMGIPSSGGSVRRNHQVCHAAATGRSFEVAAETLEEHDHIELSAKQVRMISEREGRRLVQERHQEIEAFQRREKRFEGAPTPDLVVVTADGGRIQTRQRHNGTAWKEDKVGAVYDALPQKDPGASSAEEYEGAHARMKTFVASMSSWEEFGWMLCVEAARRGYERAKERLFVSDGAVVLRSLRTHHFPDAVFILDWYHAVEHLADAAKAAFGETTDEWKTWYMTAKDHLWRGEVDAILEALRKESARVGSPSPKEPENSPRVVLHRNQGYFVDNRNGLDYPRFRAEGWPIASGVAEGSVKQFALRLKGTEKFWNGFGFGMGAEEMLALCALHRSEDGRWRAYWDRRSDPYLKPKPIA